jgi:hypothetical protein
MRLGILSTVSPLAGVDPMRLKEGVQVIQAVAHGTPDLEVGRVLPFEAAFLKGADGQSKVLCGGAFSERGRLVGHLTFSL